MTAPAVVLAVRPVRAVVTAALAAAVALATSTLVATPAGASTCGPAPQGRTAVVVVIDRGDHGGSSVHCVEVATGATGAEALFAAVGQGSVRRDDPVKGPAFVCGIGGVPASGCAAVGEPYWSYWGGDPGGWTYRSIGAFGTRLRGRCAVEGWRFGTGQAPPRGGVPAVTCEAPPAPPPPPQPPAQPPAAAPPAVVGGATTVPGAGAGPGSQPAAGSAGVSAPASGAAPSADGPGGTSAAEVPPDRAEDGAGDDRGGGRGDDQGAEVPGDGSSEESAGTVDGGSSDVERAEGRPVLASEDGRGGGPGIGSLLALLAVLGLGTATFVRSRRGTSQSPEGPG